MPKQDSANTPYPDRLLRIADVTAITSLSKSCLLLWVAQGRFPKPATPSSNLRLWRLSQVMAWMENMFEQPNGGSCSATTNAVGGASDAD